MDNRTTADKAKEADEQRRLQDMANLFTEITAPEQPLQGFTVDQKMKDRRRRRRLILLALTIIAGAVSAWMTRP